MVRYSNSRLSTFEQCPQKFKFAYIDKIEVEAGTSVEAFMGELVHQALEKLYRDLAISKLNSPEELLLHYSELWEENWSDDIIIVKQEFTPEDYKKRGAQFILWYYDKHKPFNQGKTIGIETENLMSLGNGHEYHVRMDRFVKTDDGVYEVHDYKTNARLKSQEEVDQDRQLAMYSLWVRENFSDAKQVRLVWHFLAYNKTLTSYRTMEQLQKLKQETVDTISKIESTTEFLPNKSTLCSWCEFQGLCPAFKKESVPVEEEAQKLADAYTNLLNAKDGLEVELNKLKQKLIVFSEENNLGLIYGSNKKIAIKARPKVLINDELKMLLLKHGIWNEFAMLDHSKLADALHNKELPEEVAEFLQKASMSKTFKVDVSDKDTLSS